MSVQMQQLPTTMRPPIWDAYQRLVAERTGLQLSKQQTGELGTIVANLLAKAGVAATPEELYASFLRGERADLFAALAARLTIGETHFFRVAPQIAALREVVFPDLLARRADLRRLECWSAGCSSGEEPYTLAMVLREFLPIANRWQLGILGTDLSATALEAARRASYRDWSFRETPDPVRRRYFERKGDTWQLSDTIRRMVRFAPLNLAADPFPVPSAGTGGFDLILCRNVTIYFGAEITQKVYRRIAAALAPGGWLMIGPSDPPPREHFEAVYLPHAVLWRKPAALAPVAQPVARPRVAASAPAEPPRRPVAARSPLPAVETDPGAARLEEVRALVRDGARDAARARLAQLAQSAPLAVVAHRLLGFLALEDGLYASALESLRRATFLAADDPLAQFGLGRAYRALGDEARAGAAFRHARRVLSTWPGDRPIPGDEDLVAEDLRVVLDAQLAHGEGQKGQSW